MNFKERAKELVEKMTLDEKMSQTRYDSPAIPRLGIPAYNWWNEALHGVARSGAATVFPQAIGMAASFNTELVGKVAVAILPVSSGSSPYVSCPLPHLGSLKIFIFGDQKVSP